jgi:internalin A
MNRKTLLTIIEKADNERWEKLDLSGNGLMELPPEIGSLTHLKSLILGKFKTKEYKQVGNNLTILPEEIGNLSSLESLYVPYNHLNSLPLTIGNLSSLKILSVKNNKLHNFPSTIFSLCSLEKLYLDCNQLENLPPEIQGLSSLKELYLLSNKLSKLPPELFNLYSLEILDLRNNQITSLSSKITKLVALKSLYLHNNQIKNLPSEISQISSLKSLYLKGNPLETPPLEIAEQGIDTIRKYFHQLDQEGYDTIYEAKLLIVGEGESGKTSLMNKILDPEYLVPQAEEATHGIQIKTFQFFDYNQQKYKVNIWDFGGQEIYHQTHQFFLTKRSLYILVADSRKEHIHLDYWLHIIKLLSQYSPLLIIKNEKNNYSVDIQGESQILDIFYPMVKEIISTNLATNRGLDKIIKAFKYHINQLPQVGIKIPKSWIKIRQDIEQDKRDYISLQEYLEVCDSHQYTHSTSFDDNEKNSSIIDGRLKLSQFFHDLGIILHFQDNEASLLYDTVILKPQWITQAVYELLKRENNPIKQNFGKFTYADLKTIWNNKRYKGKYRELLELMKRFKLCYELPDKTYIAPQLLEDKRPLEYHWDNTNNLKLRYRYDFMPKGILSRFIVEMNSYIDETNVWRSGVVLTKDNTYAELIETDNDREIKIRLRGNNKRGLLELITSELDTIHISYHNLKVDKLIPCNCNTCITIQDPYLHKLENLRNLLGKNRQESQCQISGDLVNIYRLIDDTIGRQELNKFDNKNIINLNINQGDNMNNPINQNHSGNGDNVAGNKMENITQSGNFGIGVNKGTVTGNAKVADVINEYGYQKLNDIAQELTRLLDYFEQNNLSITEAVQRVNVAKETYPELNNTQIIEATIVNQPTLKQRILSASKAASIETMKALLPPVGIAIEAIKAYQNP